MTAVGRQGPSTSDDLVRFITLAETEHMTDAAAALRITQPTLSRTLARLESDLGAPLFDRRHGRLLLNASGEIYLDHARRAQQRAFTVLALQPAEQLAQRIITGL